MQSLAQTATWLLGRPLTPQDGLAQADLHAAEQRIGQPLPAPLRDFYATLGGNPVLTGAFQRFAKPEEWTFIDGKIIFLEENQEVCYWATDQSLRVYQTTDLQNPQWQPEPLALEDFLTVILYYQMAQGGYPFCAMMDHSYFQTPQDIQTWLDRMQAKPVVNSNGLKIFTVAEQALVWYLHGPNALPDPGLFLCTRHQKPFQTLCKTWPFEDLG